MTWYTKKPEKTIQKEAASEGKLWLTPEGNHIPSEAGGHEIVGAKILESMEWKPVHNGLGGVTQTLLSKGYARLNYDGPLMNIQFSASLTSDQINTLVSDFSKGKFFMALIDSSEGRKEARNAYGLRQALTNGVVANLKRMGIIKTASTPYGYWIGPNGDTIPVEEYQAHGKKASVILEDLGESPSGDQFDDRDSLLEKGWVSLAHDPQAGLAMFRGDMIPNDSQIETIKNLSNPEVLPNWIFGVSVDFPGKLKMFMIKHIKNISGFLKAEDMTMMKKHANQTKMIKTADGGTKMIKVANKELEDFFRQPDAVQVNPKNQVGNYASLYDVQRYVMDSYAVKTSISKNSRRITVAIFVNHAFLGSLAFNKYWNFEFDEWKKAIQMYKDINKISQDTIEEFVDQEITTTVFWPILKFKLDKLEPERNIATNIPWVNYSRYYDQDDNPDWRENIYGKRYPKYDEPSYNEEVRRKGIFTD